MPRRILFVGGVHGVGKSTLCDSIGTRLNITHCSASELIAKRGNVSHDTNKRVADVGRNQDILIEAISECLPEGERYVLDGHFCLLSREGKVEQVPTATFEAISPVAILVLFDDPEKIFARLRERDKERYALGLLASFQELELNYSESVAKHLNVPYLRVNPVVEPGAAMEFVERYL